jgi:hypothetical protein
MSPGWFDSVANQTPGAGSLLAAYPTSYTIVHPTTGQNVSMPVSSGAAAFMTHFHLILDPSWVSPSSPGAGPLWDRSGYYPRRAFYSRPLIISSGPDKKLGLVQATSTPTAAALIQIENNAVLDLAGIPDGQVLDNISNQGLSAPAVGAK